MSPKRAGTGYMWAVIVFIVLSLLLAVMLQVIPMNMNLWGASAVSQAAIFLPIFAAALLTPAAMKEQFPFRRIDFVTGFAAVLMTVVLYPAVIVINAVSMLFVPNEVEALAEEFVNLPTGLVLLAIGVIGPLSEEICFRGFIYQNLRSSGRVAASVVLSAVMFGFMHLNFNQASYAIVLGIFLALAVEASGSLWTSVIIHTCFNSFEVLLTYAGREILQAAGEDRAELVDGLLEDPQALLASIPVYAAMGIGGILLAVLLLKLMAARKRRRIAKGLIPAGPENVKKKDVLSFSAVVGLVLAAVYMVEMLFLV